MDVGYELAGVGDRVGRLKVGFLLGKVSRGAMLFRIRLDRRSRRGKPSISD